MINIVLGTGFGDEGKGQAVHSLSHQKALVIRFSGGHQCGHTAIASDGKRHIFSQFGAGTFKGSATFISAYCTVFPTAFRNEYLSLKSLDTEFPPYVVDPMAMLTTPYDLAFNRALSIVTGHGTCGVGFGTTLQRNEDFYNLYVNDLQTPYVFETKMSFIQQYYEQKVRSMNMSSQITYEQELENAFSQWDEDLLFYKDFIQIATIDDIAGDYSDFVFEGSQGIMLDQHFGFFPQVTRSNTTAKNAIEIIRQSAFLQKEEINTYYLSRCYQTRHGHGPFPIENTVELINTENESNLENDWQGAFKIAAFDASLVLHAISCDRIYNNKSKKIIVLTCFDQLANKEKFLDQLRNSKLNEVCEKILIKEKPDWVM